MADLGSIGTLRPTRYSNPIDTPPELAVLGRRVHYRHYVATWRMPSYLGYQDAGTVTGNSTQILLIPTQGSLTVNVKDTGANLFRCKVALYYRDTGALVANGLTDVSGNCTFYGLDTTDTGAYMAVAFDPDGGTSYNAAVYDKLTAV
jgi:hypothetical protein